MTSQYSRDHCKIALAKVLQTIGWHSINSTPLEVLTDILARYIQQISKVANEYSNEFGQTEPNLDHLGLAFQEMGINLGDLEEYVTYVNFCPNPSPVPKFPIPKENNLNFLKPGSKEVVTRPVHINEHLPPMYPLLEGGDEEASQAIKEEITIEETTLEDPQQFKKPLDVIPPEYRKFKKDDESGSRPTREISSVMMTTSGFLSPAREGKLPEAKAPVPPPAPDPPPVLPTPPPEPVVKKKVEKRKEPKMFRPVPEEKASKKAPTIKDLMKMKQKMAAAAGTPQPVSPSGAVTLTPLPISPNIPVVPEVKALSPMSINPKHLMKEKMDRALAAAKAKTEKLNTTITPIPFKSPSPINIIFPPQAVEKLHNEPDRKKVNIFRKISNVKESKSKKEPKNVSPMIIVDEATEIVNKITHLSSDITIEPIHPVQMSKKMDWSFDDGSPPTTPLTPKTPDIMTSPIVIVEKRKRKDPTPKVKRPKKQQHQQLPVPAHFMDDVMDGYNALFDRPKTPDTIWHQLNMKQVDIDRKHPPNQSPLNFPHMGPPHIPFPFLGNFGGPGLIPQQLTTPMFPFSQFGNLPNFSKNSYFAPNNLNVGIPSSPTSRKTPPIGSPSSKVNDAVEIKPVEIIPQIQKSPQPPIQVPEASSSTNPQVSPNEDDTSKQKNKEHKKEKKDKIKKKNKKDKEKKEKSEKKKLKELKKDEKEKVKKEKKIKKKEKLEKQDIPVVESPIPKILLKVNSPSPRPETPDNPKRLNIKVIKNEDTLEIEDKKREPSPGGLAKISALVTGPPKPKSTLSPTVAPPPVEKVVEEPPPVPRTPGRPRLHPLKPKPPPKPKKVELPFKKIDEHGNEVWICPSCGQQDDGRPMIGCDGCDAWYHWVCVGIQVPPDENENWYCKPCLCKKNEDLQSDKKRKRKRKEKKDH